jgi:hypothetical protein
MLMHHRRRPQGKLHVIVHVVVRVISQAIVVFAHRTWVLHAALLRGYVLTQEKGGKVGTSIDWLRLYACAFYKSGMLVCLVGFCGIDVA